MFLMGREQKVHSRHSLCPTPLPLLPILRIWSHPPNLPPPRRSFGNLNLSPLPPHRPLIPRSFFLLLLLLFLNLHLLPWWPLTWSAVCLQSGDCQTPALTHASYVSLGQRTAASSTDEQDTWCPATSAPGSWRKEINSVQFAGCPSTLSSSPTSAETPLLFTIEKPN